jgi:hypothetical protein
MTSPGDSHGKSQTELSGTPSEGASALRHSPPGYGLPENLSAPRYPSPGGAPATGYPTQSSANSSACGERPSPSQPPGGYLPPTYTPGHPRADYVGGAAPPPRGTSRLALWSLGASVAGWVSAVGLLSGLKLVLFVADPAAIVGVVLGIVALVRISRRDQKGLTTAIVGVTAGCFLLLFTVFLIGLAWASFAQMKDVYRSKQ